MKWEVNTHWVIEGICLNDSGKVWGTGPVGESLNSRGHRCHMREPGMAKQLPVEGKN